MAKIPICYTCGEAQPLVLVVEKSVTKCAACGNPILWRETDDALFTLTHNDRKFLHSLHISTDEPTVKS